MIASKSHVVITVDIYINCDSGKGGALELPRDLRFNIALESQIGKN
jgi:hypothetical protein